MKALYWFWFLIIQIDITLLILMALGLIMRRKKLVKYSLILFFSLYFLPLGKLGIYWLESKYKNQTAPNLQKLAPYGAIYLGGAITGNQKGAPKKRAIYNEAAPRLYETIELLKEFPLNKVVITGTPNEAKNAKRVFKNMGVHQNAHFLPNALSTLDNSNNTLKNSQERKQKFLLITSAFHLYRSEMLFKKAGWTNIVPYPTNFFYGFNNPLVNLSEYLDGRNIRAYKIFIKEIAGIVNFKILQ